MSFVAAGTFVVGEAAAASLGTFATGLIGGSLVGAGAGALYNGVTGRSVLNGALYGGLIGGAGGALGGAFAGAGALGAGTEVTGQIGQSVLAMQEAGATSAEISQSLMANYGMTADQAAATMSQVAQTGSTAGGINMGASSGQLLSGANTVKNAAGAEQQLDTSNVPNQNYKGVGIQPNGTNVVGRLNTADLATSTTGAGGLNPQYYGDQTSSIFPSQSPAVPTSAGATVTNPWAAPGSENAYGPGWSSAGFQGGEKVQPSMFSKVTDYMKEHPGLTAAAAGAAILASQKNALQPNYLPQYNPPTAASYGLNRTLSANYRPTRPMAEGGIAALADGGSMQSQPENVNFMGNDMYPQSQMHRSYYATPSQMPTSAQQVAASYEPKTNPLTGQMTANMANGGVAAAGVTGLQSNQPADQAPASPLSSQYIQDLASQYSSISTPHAKAAPKADQGPDPVYWMKMMGAAKGGQVGGKYNLGSYSDGGRLLKGPGDGMSDDIPASIADKQPARLADGEFVVPADVVSHLGNGSTDAGAKHLYKMMDNVRKARTGRKSQGKQIKAGKFLPK